MAVLLVTAGATFAQDNTKDVNWVSKVWIKN